MITGLNCIFQSYQGSILTDADTLTVVGDPSFNPIKVQF